MKNWLIFGIFSLASAYTHYYGLATAGVINVVLFVYLLVKAIKLHKLSKENKLYTTDLKCFTISAVIQIALYLPWIVCLFTQMKQVAGGFWIQWIPFGKVWLQIFTFQFTGDLENNYISLATAIVFGSIWLIYIIYTMIKAIRINKQNVSSEKNKEQSQESSNKPGIWAIGVYGIVIIILFIISLKVPILYARYLLNLTGIFWFFMAFFIVKGGKKTLTMILSIITIIDTIIVNISVTKMNYAESNYQPLAYIKQDLQAEDLLLFQNDASGFVISMQLIENQNCFYDKDKWNVDAAYEAFGKDLHIIKDLEQLEDYEGRIWIIDASDYNLYHNLENKYSDDIKLIKQEKFSIQYHLYQYAISLVEKTK